MSTLPPRDPAAARARGGAGGRESASDAPPVRVDIAARARERARLAGHCAVAQLPRLADAEAAPGGTSGGGVRWQADFSLQSAPGRPEQPWVQLVAQTRLTLVCQRCLAPVQAEVTVERDFRFVADERTAEVEDETSEEDVLATSPRFDLRSLLEDELLMALPVVPMHEVCPAPLAAPDRIDGPVSGDVATAERPNPFAVLGRLKAPARGPGGGDGERGAQ